jgi:regulator of cell morphogenesis and NO signaling
LKLARGLQSPVHIRTADEESPMRVSDWNTQPQDHLIDHLLTRYHARHREQLPELVRMASRVEQVHAQHLQCPTGLADLLRDMQQELENHMLKEEQVLFPMLQMGMGAQAATPIQVMRYEHDQHAEALEQLLSLTNQITPPAEACNTWRSLYRELSVFHADLREHIHLENDILFAKAAAPGLVPARA